MDQEIYDLDVMRLGGLKRIYGSEDMPVPEKVPQTLVDPRSPAEKWIIREMFMVELRHELADQPSHTDKIKEKALDLNDRALEAGRQFGLSLKALGRKVVPLVLIAFLLQACAPAMMGGLAGGPTVLGASAGMGLLNKFRGSKAQPVHQLSLEEQIKQAETKRRLCRINNGVWVNGFCVEPDFTTSHGSQSKAGALPEKVAFLDPSNPCSRSSPGRLGGLDPGPNPCPGSPVRALAQEMLDEPTEAQGQVSGAKPLGDGPQIGPPSVELDPAPEPVQSGDEGLKGTVSESSVGPEPAQFQTFTIEIPLRHGDLPVDHPCNDPTNTDQIYFDSSTGILMDCQTKEPYKAS